MPITPTPRGPVHWTEQCANRADPVVVLLHGLGGDAGFWSVEQHALSARYRVLAMELRGNGITPTGDEALSIDAMARDVVSVLDEQGIDAAHIVGFSMGGLVAQAMATAWPDRVRSLVLAATFATTPVSSRLFLKAVADCYARSITARQRYALILPWLFSREFLESERAVPFLSFPEGEPEGQTPDDWIRSLNAQLAFDGRAGLAKIQARTLVMHGADDVLAPPCDAAALHRGIRNAAWCTIAGGHLFHVERPQRFLDALLEFLGDASAR